MKIVPYIVGDVHLGRKFTTGVPLHRRGDRERMVAHDFEQKVANCNSKLFVQTGDLFDAFAVEEAVVLDCARVVKFHARHNPEITYVFYRGNHDASKDANKASSFDVFAELMEGTSNVKVMKEPEAFALYIPGVIESVSLGTRPDKNGLTGLINKRGESSNYLVGFIPWSPFKSANELAQELIEKCKDNIPEGVKFDAVFGHWDTGGFGDESNIVPTAILKDWTNTIYTGHVHTPSVFERDGVTVNVVGSMQPYSHAEDPYHLYYKTITFADYSAYGPIEKEWCRNLNLRILVKDGEVPDPCDCLSFTTKKVTETEECDEAPDLDVKMEDFNMDALFLNSLNQVGVRGEVSEKIIEKFKELRNAS